LLKNDENTTCEICILYKEKEVAQALFMTEKESKDIAKFYTAAFDGTLQNFNMTSIDNEELNGLLTTIRNQGEEIDIKTKEISHLQAKVQKLEIQEEELRAELTKKTSTKKTSTKKATSKKAKTATK